VPEGGPLARRAVVVPVPVEGSGASGSWLLVARRSGEALRLGPTGRVGLIGLPQVAAELYASARVLRLFTWGERREVDGRALLDLATRDAADVTRLLERGTAMLGRARP
jgi:hypothetical protein